MFINVIERRWELALQRTIGMSRGEIAGTLVVESGATGYLGACSGALFGAGSGYAIVQALNGGFGFDIGFQPPALLAAGASLPAIRFLLRKPVSAILSGELEGRPPGGRLGRRPWPGAGGGRPA